jgi:S1-C subfamily serine protease
LLGDILVALDGETVDDGEVLQALLGGDRVGRKVTVEVIRGGAPVMVDVTVGQRPGRTR